MNIQQINSEISITDYLASQGIQPAYRRGCDWWYISPVRMAERSPSFKVNTRLNRWYDHGTGEGGKVIDLALRLHRTASIREVIRLLSGQTIASAATSSHGIQSTGKQAEGEVPPLSPAPFNSIKVLAAKPLEENSPLANYLLQRGISLHTAGPFCQEVSFSIGSRRYEAIGFQNRSGGYELRNAWFKGSSSPKDITFVDNGAGTVCLVEGFMDFLSLLELRPRLTTSSSFLVLNSLALVNRSLDVLGRHRQVLLFLDHDQAGRKVTERLLRSGLNCRDRSSLYQNYKDVNELLVARRGKPKKLRPGFGHRKGARGRSL
ncbi:MULTISPECIES: toprim domain-containing protein [Pontibacter]|uniref:Toprim domain-containing protein n=2 Tax=Pontibacter TaxID=323449 RepID=A0A2U1B4Y5_9BACT|nr:MULTISPECIES: toprim domain-containing protein [Pontibacter]PVY43661.1 Toprim domain-containing protein [Pontibacter virosus]GGG18818.1 DNA primase [Pontibacter amylolyticus]